jgi:hypothetical protein
MPPEKSVLLAIVERHLPPRGHAEAMLESEIMVRGAFGPCIGAAE